jgi:hypothetical protein
MVQAISGLLVLLTAFQAGFTLPTDLAAPPACGGGPAMAADESLYVWVVYKPDSSTVADTLRYYSLGYWKPGDRLDRRFETARPGWGYMAVAARRERTRTWSCWCSWLAVWSDSVRCGSPGDMNLDGLMDVTDVALFAGALQAGTNVVFPSVERLQIFAPVRPAGSAARAGPDAPDRPAPNPEVELTRAARARASVDSLQVRRKQPP